jgi:hypothetical protein
MSTPVRVAAFVMALLVAFLGARAIGSVVGPVDGSESAPMAHEETGSHVGTDADGAGHGDDHQAEELEQPGGLTVSEAGYTLRVVAEPQPGADRPLRFVIEGPDGHPVTSYDEVHDKRLHLVKVRRDFQGYEHVHPTLAADGTWTARTTLRPGTTRIFADFTPSDGPELVLGTDVHVPGGFDRLPAPDATRTARVDGYRVTLEGELTPGESSLLTVTITRDGRPVTDLQPYLGAHGHLVALREGDLAYLHVHPDESGGAGPEIGFHTEVPSPGGYRLFLDFKHDGVVRTAEFVVTGGAGEDDHDH